MNNTASDKYDLSNANIKDLLTEFFEFYTTPAFGARSKSEIDLKVFELLGKCGWIDDDYYNVSRKLKITPTRAKNLILNAKLRVESQLNTEEMYNHFLEEIEKLGYKTDPKNNSIIIFSLPDMLLREYLKFKLRTVGKIWDSSFNSELVRVSVDDFLDIVSDADLKRKIKRQDVRNKIKDAIVGHLKAYPIGVLKDVLSIL